MFTKKIKSHKHFLKIVTHQKLHKMYTSEKYGNDYIVIADDNLMHYINNALSNNYVSGLEIAELKGGRSGVIVNSPIITPFGEEYLATQSFFVKHPIVEKVLLVIVAGVFSAVTTLLTNSLIQ